MRKVQLLSLLATVGVLAAVAGAASAATNVTTQVATLTAPQTMPILFGGTKVMYGKRVDQGDPIPAGSAVVKITVQPLAGQTGPALFTASCPDGMGAMDYGVPAGTNTPGGGFDAPLGTHEMQFRLFPPFTRATGPTDVYMLCMQAVSNLVTRAKSTIAPVTFPSSGAEQGIKRGQHLRRGQIVMKNSLVGIKQGQAMWSGTSCPKRYQPVLGASATTGVKALLEGDVFNILPVHERTFRATVYTVCEAFARR
jgi:hypothetical protein